MSPTSGLPSQASRYRLTGSKRPRDGRLLASVVFVDMVGSTEEAARLGDRAWRELLGNYHALIRREVRRQAGRLVDATGDGALAVFEQPAAAIRCACILTASVRALGIELRGGVHVGEIELMGDRVGGIAVHVGARLAAAAEAGEVLISSTARDLISGSDFVCTDRGLRTLKGVPGEWRTFGVVWPDMVLPEKRIGLGSHAREPVRNRRWFADRRVRVIAVLVLAFMVMGAALGAVLTRRGAQPPGSILPGVNTVAHIAAPADVFDTSVQVNETPGAVVVGDGAVYVISSAAGTGTLTRIDTANPGQQLTRGIAATPTGLAYDGAGSLWVSVGSQGAVLRFDARNLEQSPPIKDGLEVGITAIAATADAVWVVNPNRNDVVHIVPESGAVSGPAIPVGQSPEAVAIGGGSVWVANALDKSLSRVDPATNQVSPAVGLPVPPDGIVADTRAVWVASSFSSVVLRIDPVSGNIVQSIEVDVRPAGIALDGRSVWVAEGDSREVQRIDIATNRIDLTLHVGGQPVSIDSKNGSTWTVIGSG